MEASLSDKVAALRSFFGIGAEVPLVAAVELMHLTMGSVAEGALPAQISALVEATGVMPVSASAPVASQSSSPATAPATASKAAGKRKADELFAAPKANKQQTLFKVMPDAQKTTIAASELKKQRELAITGLDYVPRKEDRRTFDSESADVTIALVRSYQCSRCPRTFTTPAALATHELYHAPSVKPKIFDTPPPSRACAHKVECFISVGEGGFATVSLRINGQTLEDMAAERAIVAEHAAERAAERDAALKREAKRRHRLREAESDADKGEHRCGSGKRDSLYTAKEKLEQVDIADRIFLNPSITNKREGWADRAVNPKYYGAPFGNLTRWRKPAERRRLAKAAGQEHAATLLRIDRESRKKGKYASMEKKLFASFKARRARGRKVSARWLTHMARNLLKAENEAAAAHFKGGPMWRRRFRLRWKISIRKKTNCKNQTWEETKPVLQRYFRGLRRRITLSNEELTAYASAAADGAVPPARKKYGRYLPWQRGNVDQVPLPFVNDMDTTYEMTGAKRVSINQLGPALSKRQATGQLCFRPEVPPPPPAADAEGLLKYKKELMEQPPPTIIMRGKGNVKQEELDAYPEGLVVLWQDKAWVDRPVALEWARASWKKMVEADVAAGVADASTRYLLYQDNLDAQRPDRNPEYTAVLKDECHTDSHMLPPGKTDEVQPVDDGMGRQVKIYMGQLEDEWLEDDENLEKWEGGVLSASDRRVLIATWFFKAFERACEGLAKRKYFEHTGALMTADNSDDHLIKLEAKPKGEVFTFTDEASTEQLNEPEPDEPEPDDVAPQREVDDSGNSGTLELDDEDEPDEDDTPPAPREPPEGFIFAVSPPSEAALAFSKQAAPEADALVGQSILFHWPVIGWHIGTIQRRVFDGRTKRGGQQCNFYIHYEVDDDEVPTVLELTAYDGADEGCWVLLQQV